ncbi:MAG: IS21 family transposase [Desulfobacteraceae bacterium]|nr:MAG: IS21 family transposase [Desulfobacteraceae bacterium]
MNVLKPDKKSTIITLLKNGVSQHEIRRKTKIDRKTIRKYSKLIKEADDTDLDLKFPAIEEVATGYSYKEEENPPPWPPVDEQNNQDKQVVPSQCRSACEVHRLWIEEQIRVGRNAVAIYQDLVERFGFTNKYNSVKRFVRGLKKKDPEQFDRLEYLPGEEAQVDYGLGAKTLHPSGKYRKPRLFVMTLKYSRRAFRKVVWKSSQQIWAKLHEEAFSYFGGCPQYVVLDNLKEGVIKPDIYEPQLNPVYAAMLEHYEVVADPARVRDPNRKGTVENAIQHTQNTALKGRKFESIKNQNEFLMNWEQRWAAQRIHGRMKRKVEEMFQEEKPYLKELPLTSFRYFYQESRTVWDDGTIQVGQCYYSALPARLYQKVIVRIYEYEIEIIEPATMEVIRRHIKSFRAGYVQMEEKDRIFNPSRQTSSLFSRAGKIGPETKRLCELLFEDQGRSGQRRMQGIVNLVRHFEAPHIEEGAKIAVKMGLRSCKSIRKLVENIAQKSKDGKKVNCSTLTQDHPLIRPPQDYALFWEQHAACARSYPEHKTSALELKKQQNDLVILREQLPQIWQNASWQRVIEVFGLEVDTERRCRADEIWIKSPFTQEKSASLHLNVTKNIFKDFSSGMGAKVGILNFCQKLLKTQGHEMNCYEVARWMLEKGISCLNDLQQIVIRDEKGKIEECSKEPQNQQIKVDLRKWLQFRHPELKRRGISEATCRYLGCGFLPDHPSGGARSPLNGRVVFQVRGVTENGSSLKPVILTHVGRSLTAEQEKMNGRYWSFPFFKGLEIYNQDKLLLDYAALCQIKQFGLVLVEGFFDAAGLIEAGCLNVGALMGSCLTEKQVDRLKFITSRIAIPKITIFLDRDEAGKNGSAKAIFLLKSSGFVVEPFDWNQSFEKIDGSLVTISDTICDPGDMSAHQIKWLRKQGKI